MTMIDVAIPRIAQELHLTQGQVQATVGLLDDRAAVPFIARYRKEATASLNEVAITNIRDRLSRLRELRDRQGTILHALEERGLLTEELRKAVLSAETMATLEDIYLPYRPKRRTRATIARERGLEPLALRLWDQQDFEVKLAAVEYVDRELGVETVEDALGGARDIIAEWVNEETTARGKLRKLFWSQGTFSSKVVSGKASEAAKYRDYFEWEEPVIDVPSHRLLAMLRGEREALLSTHIAPPVSQAIAILEGMFVTGETEASQQVRLAVEDSYQRLLEASMETEVGREARIRAEDTAIRVFANNLRELLLAPALGQKNVLALDPGFRTGCKLVCLDRQGRLLHHDTVYPLLGGWREREAAKKVAQLCGQYHVEAIAVGNGTGGRETEAFLGGLELGPSIPVVMVSSESPVHGQQEGAAYNGHFECVCYHPLFLFNQFGDCEGATLRPGNVHSADGWQELLEPVVKGCQKKGLRLLFRGDAAFAKPELYEYLEQGKIGYAIRLPANQVIQEQIQPLLERPTEWPSREPIVSYHDFAYQAQSWHLPRRVVAKVEWHQGELFPRVGFIVTNLSYPPKGIVRFYNGRGTAEQWIKEGKYALNWTRLSCHKFVANQVRLWLFVLTYNLGNFMRRLVLPEDMKHWTLTSLQTRLIKTGGRLVRHARRLVFQLAEVLVTREMLTGILERISRLRLAPG